MSYVVGVTKELKKNIPPHKPKQKIHLHCKVCGYDWFSRIKDPLECPACKSRFWKSGKTPEGKPAISVVDGDAAEKARLSKLPIIFG